MNDWSLIADEAIHRYVKQKETLGQIAASLGISKQRVHQIMKARGITRQVRDQALPEWSEPDNLARLVIDERLTSIQIARRFRTSNDKVRAVFQRLGFVSMSHAFFELSLRRAQAAQDDCHLWTGSLGAGGYGQVHFGGQSHYVHRLAYERTHGALPDGSYVTFSCDNRLCLNPRHLLLLSETDWGKRFVAIKIARGMPIGGGNQKKKAFCKHGHPLEPGNLYYSKLGKRRCATCSLMWTRATTDKRRRWWRHVVIPS